MLSWSQQASEGLWQTLFVRNHWINFAKGPVINYQEGGRGYKMGKVLVLIRGRSKGGGSWGSGPHLSGTPKLHKEGKQCVCVYANTASFCTKHFPPPPLFPKSCIRPWPQHFLTDPYPPKSESNVLCPSPFLLKNVLPPSSLLKRFRPPTPCL